MLHLPIIASYIDDGGWYVMFGSYWCDVYNNFVDYSPHKSMQVMSVVVSRFDLWNQKVKWCVIMVPPLSCSLSTWAAFPSNPVTETLPHFHSFLAYHPGSQALERDGGRVGSKSKREENRAKWYRRKSGTRTNKLRTQNQISRALSSYSIWLSGLRFSNLYGTAVAEQ